MKKREFVLLARKISDGTASEQEIRLYNAYYNYFQQDKKSEPAALINNLQLGKELKSRIERRILSDDKKHTPSYNFRWIAAAAVFLLISSVGFWYLENNDQTHLTAKSKPNSEIKPGGNKAILTLDNGLKIVLNDTKNGILVRQGEISINKLSDGRLAYQKSDNNTSFSDLGNRSQAFNSISTPRGGQFQIDLPDGTKVWLNAASTLRYPVTFTGSDRVVMLSGEAYFEVAHVVNTDDEHQTLVPFKVIVNGREEVHVLGTHFNIMAYLDDNKSKTTLLEGSVRIVKGKQHKLLVPGQQAQVGADVTLSEADTEEAVAWRYGKILFKDENLKAIMSQISRWYDVDIEYAGNIPERLFTGGISRNSDLSSLLKILELNNIHFKIQGKTITVTP